MIGIKQNNNMLFAKIGDLSLKLFDKESRNDLEFVKKLCKDQTISKWFQGIMVGLTHNPRKEFFNHSFLVAHNDELIGYINISNYNEEEKCVYLRAAIDFDKRGNSYGKILLNEITQYIFEKYKEVENIRLKIDKNNKPSINTAITCEYKWFNDDFYIKYSPYINLNKTK